MKKMKYVILPVCVLIYTTIYSQFTPVQELVLLKSLIKDGTLLMQHRQFDSAIIKYKLAHEYMIKNDYTQTKIGIECQLMLANLYLLDGQVDFAQNYINQTEALIESKNMSNQFGPLYNYMKGRIHYILAQADSADYYYKISFLQCNETGKDSLKVMVIKDLGNVLFLRNEYDSALILYKNALELELKRPIPSELLLSSLYQNISIIYSKRYEYEIADVYFNKSLEIKERILPKDDILLIKAYLNYSVFLTQIGKFKAALEYSQKSQIAIISKYGNHYYLLGHIYYNNSLIYELLEKEYKAEYYIEKALFHYQNYFSNSQTRLNKITYNLAFALYRLDKRPSAILKITEILKNNPTPTMKVLSLDLLARCYLSQQKFQKTDSCYKKAISIIEKFQIDNNLSFVLLLSEYGHFLYTQDNYDSAVIYLERAVNNSKVISTSVITRFGINDRLAKCYLKQNKYTKSIKIYLDQIDEVMNINQNGNFVKENEKTSPEMIKILVNAYFGYANANLKKYNNTYFDTSSLVAAVEAFNQTKILLLKYQTKLYNIDYFTENNTIYTELLQSDFQANILLDSLLNGNNQKEKLLNILEDYKASYLKLSINSLNALQYSEIPNHLISYEKQIKNRFIYYDNCISNLLIDDSSLNLDQLNKYKDKRFRAQVIHDSLITLFELQYENYYDLKYNFKKTDITDIQHLIPIDACMVNFWIDQNKIYFGLITANSTGLIYENYDVRLKYLVNNYHKLIKKGGSPKEIISLSQELYSYLISPIEDIIKNKKRLIIIPDDHLFYIPFESLCKPNESESPSYKFSDQHYLIQDYSISYHYSASLWFRSLQNNLAENSSSTYDGFLGVAPFSNNSDHNFSHNSDRNSNTLTYRTKASEISNYSELPFSGQEITDISRLFSSKGFDTCTLLGQNATEPKFKKAISSYKYIHLATHGFSNDLNPELSGLAFTQNNLTNLKEKNTYSTIIQPDEDGVLYSGEMYNLDLNADLLVLSACETGIGKLIKGEGMMAMTRGLIYSGAKNIVYTHWKISDKHTHQFMLHFYRAILNGNSYPESLRIAKIKMLKEESTAYPKLWSGYMLIGE